jgi:soluble lytic murein transglycosylase-like protein
VVATLLAAPVGVATMIPASVQAANQTAVAAPEVTSALPPKPVGSTTAPPPKSARTVFFRTLVRGLLAKEVQNTGLPADVADAVVHVESDYNPDTIGSVGEIGLMQVRPETAAMLGFRGSNDDLAKPDVNIHYGVIYLSKAWRLANGDLCRALMKYRAGHGEEVMSPLSEEYCRRARVHLASLGSPFAAGGATAPVSAPALASVPQSKPSPDSKPSKLATNSPTEVYARYRQGTAAASRAFWAAHDAKVHAITARLEARWHRVASR